MTTTRQIAIKNLKPGMVIVNQDTGASRIVTGFPMACAKGYYRVSTTGEAVNNHGSREVSIQA